ncbi:MAG: hypothetical protein EU536_04815 [Promethearchaeota archaeon]|nr:MAG: hypothetical protein EU536_04815 [Candidatus Lokiarchaeota archaeon]
MPFCVKCGKEISETMYESYNEMCSACVFGYEDQNQTPINYIEEYRNQKYQSETFTSHEDLLTAILNQKVFVFKRRLIPGDFFLPVIPLGISILFLILKALNPKAFFPLIVSIVAFCVFTVFAIIFLYIPSGGFAAVGPQGLEFYSKLSKYEKYNWSEVASVRQGSFSQNVKFYLKDYGRAKEIIPENYNPREFPAKNSVFLIRDTFLLYWELSKHKGSTIDPRELLESLTTADRTSISPTIRSPPLIQLGPPCPECNKATTYIPQYQRYYCNSCQKYV